MLKAEGGIKSQRLDHYSYHTYDQEAVKVLRQIVMLRELRIPLKQIDLLIKNPVAHNALEVFYKNYMELEKETEALVKLKELTAGIIRRIQEELAISDIYEPLDDQVFSQMIETMNAVAVINKEDNAVEDLKNQTCAFSDSITLGEKDLYRWPLCCSCDSNG